MKPYKSPSIDEIKKKYEYKIDPYNFIDTAYIVYALLNGRFALQFESYKFDEKIEEIKKMINNKRDKIDKTTLESFEKTLKDISNLCEEVNKKLELDCDEISPIISGISMDYERNTDKPGAVDIYLKISKEMIDMEVYKYIKYERIFVLYNEHIIYMKKN